jgi:hypothetical protein
MSTKIYSGIRFNVSDLREIFFEVDAFRDVAAQWCKDDAQSKIMQIAATIYDKLTNSLLVNFDATKDLQSVMFNARHSYYTYARAEQKDTLLSMVTNRGILITIKHHLE